MARSAVQFVGRDKKAVDAKLKVQMDDLVNKGVLHPLMKDWADEVRLLANSLLTPMLRYPQMRLQRTLRTS
jgi:hypothetical protein